MARMKLSRLICHVVHHVMSVLTMSSGYVMAARCDAFRGPLPRHHESEPARLLLLPPPMLEASDIAVSHRITNDHRRSQTYKATLQSLAKRIDLRPGRHES